MEYQRRRFERERVFADELALLDRDEARYQKRKARRKWVFDDDGDFRLVEIANDAGDGDGSDYSDEQ